MELSVEETNFVKSSKVVLDVVPKYLRSAFKKKWNEKYPEKQWQSNIASGEFLLNELPEKVKKERRSGIYVRKLRKGNEKEWDTTTLAFAMLKSGLGLTMPCRPKEQRMEPLHISEAIEIITETRNILMKHALKMSCSVEVFERVMKDIKHAARYLADDAEREINEVVSLSKIELKLIFQLMIQVKEEESRQSELEDFLKGEIEELKVGSKEVLEQEDTTDQSREIEELKVGSKEVLEQEDMTDQSKLSKAIRDKLRKDLELWHIRLINPHADGKVFLWGERNREKYMAELSLFQATLYEKIPYEMRMSRNVSELDKAHVKYNDLITAKERKCFLRGVAGIGKTSLVEHIALKWAKRELFLDKDGSDLFDFLFLIKCRELEEKSGETIKEFFIRKFHVDPDKLKGHGKRVLIIVDGIDEDAKLETSINTSTKLQALLKRDHEFLKGHATIVSGRPHIESVFNALQEKIGEYTRIEVAGLSPTEIGKYIDVIANGNKAAGRKIKQTIRSSTNMLALAAIPQYLGTLCCILSMPQEGANLNTETITPLYVCTLDSFWTHHVRNKDQQGKDFKEKFRDKEVAKLYNDISMLSFKLLKEKKIIFNEEEFSFINNLSEEHQEIFFTFFIKEPSGEKPSYHFEHLTLHEFFAATYCMLNRIEITDILKLELFEVVRFIGGFIAAKESTDSDNIVKLYIECLENAKEEEDKNVQRVQKESGSKVGELFNSVLEYLKESKGRSEFAQHYALSLFHEMFQNARGGRNQYMANLDIDVITHFQDILDHPAFIHYGMPQIELSYLVHFIESLFASGLQYKLNDMTLRIRFSTLENEEILRRLFKSFLFFKNVWFTRCNFTPYPWEMMNQSGSSPSQSKLTHLYIERCKMTEAEFMQLAHFIPFAEKVELVELALSDANCQEMIDAIMKEHETKSARLKELKLILCTENEDLLKKLKSIKTINVYFSTGKN